MMWLWLVLCHMALALVLVLSLREMHSCVATWIRLLDKVTSSVKPEIILEVKLERRSFSQIRLELKLLVCRSDSSIFTTRMIYLSKSGMPVFSSALCHSWVFMQVLVKFEYILSWSMGVGRGVGEPRPMDFEESLDPWILKKKQKKVVFLISSGKKHIWPLLAPPRKNFGKIH